MNQSFVVVKCVSNFLSFSERVLDAFSFHPNFSLVSINVRGPEVCSECASTFMKCASACEYHLETAILSLLSVEHQCLLMMSQKRVVTLGSLSLLF